MRTTALFLSVAAALAGCGGSSSAPTTTTATTTTIEPAANTGFFAIATAGGRQKLYVPAQPSLSASNAHAQLAVVDAAAANNTIGLLSFIDLGVDGAVQAVGGSGTDLVAVDVNTPTVYFVDANTGTLRSTAALPIQAKPILASDNSSFSMGAAVDAKKRRAWVSVSYGLLEYNLDTFAVTDTFNVPTPENFTYDPAGRIYVPFYLCEPVTSSAAGTCQPYVHGDPSSPAVTDSLAIVDLTTASPRTAYTLTNPGATDTQAPLGLEPDAVAVDTLLGVAVLAIEEPSTLQVLDLSKAQFHADLTCGIPGLVAAVTMPGLSYTGVAADTDTHLAIASQEYASGVVFLDLAKAKQGTLATLETTMPLLPDGVTPWTNRGDPHGTIVGLVGGKPYAFLVTKDRDWIARIDLRGVAAVMAGTGAFADQVAYIQIPPPP